jgi:hypothetical protein
MRFPDLGHPLTPAFCAGRHTGGSERRGDEPVEPGERALDEPAEHAKAAAVGRAATAEDRNNAAGGEAITLWPPNASPA